MNEESLKMNVKKMYKKKKITIGIKRYASYIHFPVGKEGTTKNGSLFLYQMHVYAYMCRAQQCNVIYSMNNNKKENVFHSKHSVFFFLFPFIISNLIGIPIRSKVEWTSYSIFVCVYVCARIRKTEPGRHLSLLLINFIKFICVQKRLIDQSLPFLLFSTDMIPHCVRAFGKEEEK